MRPRSMLLQGGFLVKLEAVKGDGLSGGSPHTGPVYAFVVETIAIMYAQ